MNHLARTSMVVLLLVYSYPARSLAQAREDDEAAIKSLVQEAYVGGVYNDDDTEAMEKGFHEKATIQQLHHQDLAVYSLKQWRMQLDRTRSLRPGWNDRTTAEVEVVGLEGDAAVARVDIANDGAPESTGFLALCRLAEGWRITNRISARHPMPAAARDQLMEEWEKSINQSWNPPEKVIEVLGVEPGMVIGEVGAGRGRYTLPLARRVGAKGRIYSNDIDADSLAVIRSRCERNGISNVETILGKEDDPLLPERALDMVIMVWVFHHLDDPAPLLGNVRPSLKPGAPLIIVDPTDSEIDLETAAFGEAVGPGRPTLRKRVEAAASKAGFDLKLIRVESFLPGDDIYILEATATP